MMSRLTHKAPFSEYPVIAFSFFKWLLLAIVIGVLVGASCSVLLASLFWATNYREAHTTIIWFLPIAGLAVGLMYHYWGQNVSKGNNQLLEELDKPKDIIPFRMAPFIFIGTVASHLFGASVGREGTAVQIGGAIADQFSKWQKFSKEDRHIIILMGISAGFAGLFGTPLAGTIFALEVLRIGKVKYNALFACLIVAIIADFISRYITHYFHVPHTIYTIDIVPKISALNITLAIIAGVLFGIVSTFFSKGVKWFGLLAKYIQYAPLRPVVGGILMALLVFFIGTQYIGLGLDFIVQSFSETATWYDFAIKLILTTFCIAFGFKGGEVTPLFFIGAALGSALSVIMPLPVGLLAGMGFVAVFSGATNTPIACTFMGIELFGIESGIYIAIACVVAYIFSGHTGIYNAQIVGSAKAEKLKSKEGSSIQEIK